MAAISNFTKSTGSEGFYAKSVNSLASLSIPGRWNFIGLITGGIALLMGLLRLIPSPKLMVIPVHAGVTLILTILVSYFIWKIGVSYSRLPFFNSHVLIGAMIGSAMAFTRYYGASAVNWAKAAEIVFVLIICPLFAFAAAVFLTWIFNNALKQEASLSSDKMGNLKTNLFKSISLAWMLELPAAVLSAMVLFAALHFFGL